MCCIDTHLLVPPLSSFVPVSPIFCRTPLQAVSSVLEEQHQVFVECLNEGKDMGQHHRVDLRMLWESVGLRVRASAFFEFLLGACRMSWVEIAVLSSLRIYRKYETAIGLLF